MNAKPKIVRPCLTCGKQVARCPSLVSARTFCSPACLHESRRHGSTLKCALCEKPFYRRFGEQDREVRVLQFCSNACRQRYRALNRKASVYPRRGPVHVHRIVAAEMLGRDLLPGEVVHHIDGDKHNNDPSNLAVLPSQAEHARVHAEAVRNLRAGERLAHPGLFAEWSDDEAHEMDETQMP